MFGDDAKVTGPDVGEKAPVPGACKKSRQSKNKAIKWNKAMQYVSDSFDTF